MAGAQSCARAAANAAAADNPHPMPVPSAVPQAPVAKPGMDPRVAQVIGANSDPDSCPKHGPSGFADVGESCAKPKPPGRGAGYAYAWPIESRDDARKRCEKIEGNGQGERHLEMYDPKCAAGFHEFGSNSCTPMSWQPAEDPDAGLCYDTCDKGMDGVGPVSWDQCAAPCPVTCGASCAVSTSACTQTAIESVEASADVTLHVARLATTAGAGAPAIAAARSATKGTVRRATKDMVEEQFTGTLTRMARDQGNQRANAMLDNDESLDKAVVNEFNKPLSRKR